MKLHDPKRPCKEGLGALLLLAPPRSEPCWRVPDLHIALCANLLLRVWIYMPTSGSGSVAFELEAPLAARDLPGLILQLEEDPERVIIERFRYDYNAKVLKSRSKKRIANATLEKALGALGLDDGDEQAEGIER